MMWHSVLPGGTWQKIFPRYAKIAWLLVFVLCPASWHCASTCSAEQVSGNASREAVGMPRYRFDGCHPRFLELLRQRMHELDQQKNGIDKEEQDLEFLRQEMDQKVKLLKDLQRKLEGPVKKSRFEEQARLQHLAGVYGSMDPSRAAALLGKMDEKTVTRLFSIMKSKKVAQILARMAPDKAARISAYLYKTPPPDL